MKKKKKKDKINGFWENKKRKEFPENRFLFLDAWKK